MDTSELVTTEEIAQILHLHVNTVRRLLREGVLPGGIRLGKRWYLERAALEAWLRQGHSGLNVHHLLRSDVGEIAAGIRSQAQLVDLAFDAIFVQDSLGQILYWNWGAYKTYGWSVEDAVGGIAHDRLQTRFPVPQEQIILTVLQAGEWQGELEQVRRDGTQIVVLSRWALLKDFQGHSLAFLIVNRDITERKQAERLNNLLLSITAKLSSASAMPEMVRTVVGTSLSALGGGFSQVFQLSNDGHALIRLESIGLDQHYSRKRPQIPVDAAYPVTDVLRRQEILWIESQADYIRLYPDLEAEIKEASIHACLCFPLFGQDGPVGSMYVVFTKPKRLSPDERNYLLRLAQVCGQALERARLYEAEQAARLKADQRAERLSRLQTLSAKLSQALSQADVAQVVADNSFALMGAHIGGISILSEDGNSVEILAHFGMPEAYMQRFRKVTFDIRTPVVDAIHEQRELYLSLEEYKSRYGTYGEEARSLLPASQSWAILPMMMSGKVIGTMGYSFPTSVAFSDEDKAFMRTIADHCAMALERTRLVEEARIRAAEMERLRISRELHDAVNQTLYAANTLAETIPRMWKHDAVRAMDLLDELRHLNQNAMAEMRTLLWELRPETIGVVTLTELLSQLVSARRSYMEANINLELNVEDETSLPAGIQIAFYRIAQEGLNNITKHAQAKQVSIQFTRLPERLELTIQDDGQGFDTTRSSGGMGMKTIRERAHEIGATIKIQSEPNKGTRLCLQWDVPNPHAQNNRV